MHAYSRHLPLAVVIGVALLQGCAGFHVDDALKHSPIDWPMAGRSSAGTYVDPAAQIAFPLVQKWDADLSAGAAQNACAIVDSVLVCGTLRGELIAFDAVTGKEIGTKKISAPISGAPAVTGSDVYFCTEAGKETVFDYNLWDGEFVWKKNLGGISASPILIPAAAVSKETAGNQAAKQSDQLLCFGTLDGMFFALHPVTGEIAWKRKCAAPIEGAACALDSLVYCADTQGTVYALSAATGDVRWKQTTGGAIYAGVSAGGRTVYAGSRDHKLYALDALSGRVLWSYDCGERIMAAASVSDSLVVVPALNGTVTALSPEGRVKWKFTARGPVNAPCTIAGGFVFAASLDTWCYALSAADGSVVWKHSIDARIKTVPLVWNRALFVIGDDKTLYKFVPKP